VSTTAGYVALVHKDEGTSYGVSVPDVPGCVSAGDTLDEALANAAEALGGHLALMQADGETAPEPRSLAAISADPQLADDLDGAFLTTVRPATRRASRSALR
jgi:predicted RNase H-like HicB family nuclease